MKNKFQHSMTLSVLLHLILVGILVGPWTRRDGTWSGGLTGARGVVDVIWVTPGKRASSVIPAKAGIQNSSGILDSRRSLPRQAVSRGGNDNMEGELVKKQTSGKSEVISSRGFGEGDSPTPAGGHGAGTESLSGILTEPTVLQQIRQKILKAKKYPLVARRQGLTGAVEVLFQINQDGSLGKIKTARSSGSDILDEEALQTIRRASPFPYYQKEIILTLKYDLLE